MNTISTASPHLFAATPEMRLSPEHYLSVQRPARYIGQEINSVIKDLGSVEFHMALAFPDVYEIGMSHLGLKILYSIVNAHPRLYAERVFAPWPDLEKIMRDQGVPLTTMETGTALKELDVLGFSLQYELCATTVLQMLDLGGIPLRSQDRSQADPLVIAGGPVVLNPAPMSRFIDAFVIGEAEEVILEIAQRYIHWKRSGQSRTELLRCMKAISGVYVPALHEPQETVKKRVVDDLNQAPFPTRLIVPSCEAVHDRIGVEIARGCTRGCRFCQAGMVYRPVRERSPSSIIDLVMTSLQETGYEEVALLSLSSGDYSHIADLIETLNRTLAPRKVAISLPSLRTDTFDSRMAQEIRKVRKTGFTLAPEAGTERLRRIINKGNTEEDLETALTKAFECGWQSVKLYFMIGLPLETDADLEGIAHLARKAVKLACGRKITVSVSSFVPKAHTPFQWAEQIDIAEIKRRQSHVRRSLQKMRLKVKFHTPEMSFVEGLLARGDEAISKVIETAYSKGARFDGWDDQLQLPIWLEAMAEHDLDPARYLRARNLDETLPWDFIDAGVSKEFLVDEWRKALREEGSQDCRSGQCLGCGACDFDKIYPRLAPPLTRDISIEATPSSGAVQPSPRRFRLQYAKKGFMTLLGHHDIERSFHRAFRRAGLELAYSQGFHPHPRMRFSPPLGMGVESECEFVDFDILDYHGGPDSLLDILRTALPPNLWPVSLEETALNEPVFSGRIRYIRYHISVENVISPDALEERIREFHESAALVMTDERKGRRRERDLKTWIADLDAKDARLELVVKVSPEGAVNPREAARLILKLTEKEALSLKISKTAVQVDASGGGQQSG